MLWTNLSRTVILLPPRLRKPISRAVFRRFAASHILVSRRGLAFWKEGRPQTPLKPTAAPITLSLLERQTEALSSFFQWFPAGGQTNNTSARSVTRKATEQSLAMLSSEGGITPR